MLSIIFSVKTLWWLMLCLYIPACFALIIIVLLQKGKGQGLAGAFGMGGGMDTIFGPRSSKSLPQKITYAAAGVFMALALVMSILSGKVGRPPAPELVAEVPEASMNSLFDPSEANTGAMESATEQDGVPPEAAATEAQESVGETESSDSVESPATPVEILDTGVSNSGDASDSPAE